MPCCSDTRQICGSFFHVLRLLGGNLLWNNGGNGPGSSYDDSDDADVDDDDDDDDDNLGTGGTNIFNSG